jgi:FkbM family methyltransferase
MQIETIPTTINYKWTLNLLPFRASLPQWGFWEKERLAAMYDAIRPNDVILDIGAEQGDMTALFATWAGAGGKIIAIEPSPGFIPNIAATFAANNLKLDMLIQALVDNKTTEGWSMERAAVDVAKAMELGVSSEVGFAHLNENPPIDHLAIDTLELEQLNIITMDIEGSEYEALQGAEKTIKRCKPILFISVHPEFMWREHHHSPDDLLVMLDQWGYEPTYLAFDHEQHYMFKPRATND